MPGLGWHLATSAVVQGATVQVELRLARQQRDDLQGSQVADAWEKAEKREQLRQQRLALRQTAQQARLKPPTEVRRVGRMMGANVRYDPVVIMTKAV